MSDIIMNHTTANARTAKGHPFLSADQMRPLWDAVDEAVKNYREEDEERTGDAVIEARDRIANARTVDPLGIAYKLRATRSWRDPAKGLAEALNSPDRDERTIATIIRDLEAVSAATRRIPSRLRPLWEDYQRQWKKVCDATDAEDRAMLAEMKANVEHGTSPAAIKAAQRFAAAKKAFGATHEAFSSAPARTVDDAICKLLFVIDQANLGDEEERAVRAAIRVLKKS
jgi:hypothetical protein